MSRPFVSLVVAFAFILGAAALLLWSGPREEADIAGVPSGTLDAVPSGANVTGPGAEPAADGAPPSPEADAEAGGEDVATAESGQAAAPDAAEAEVAMTSPTDDAAADVAVSKTASEVGDAEVDAPAGATADTAVPQPEAAEAPATDVDSSGTQDERMAADTAETPVQDAAAAGAAEAGAAEPGTVESAPVPDIDATPGDGQAATDGSGSLASGAFGVEDEDAGGSGSLGEDVAGLEGPEAAEPVDPAPDAGAGEADDPAGTDIAPEALVTLQYPPASPVFEMREPAEPAAGTAAGQPADGQQSPSADAGVPVHSGGAVEDAGADPSPPESVEIAEVTAQSLDAEVTAQDIDAGLAAQDLEVSVEPMADGVESPTVSVAAAEAASQDPEVSVEAAAGPSVASRVTADVASAENLEVSANAAIDVPASPHLTIDAAELESQTLYVAGEAEGGANVRVYANERLVGEVEAGPQGRWLVEVEADVPVGEVVIRADATSADNAGLNAEVVAEFQRFEDGIVLEPVVTASGEPDGQVSAEVDLLPPTYIIIRRGDNLWRISRRNYGRGIRYHAIFEANRDQIRNPHWIYPGQVFIMPESDRSWASAVN